MTYQGVDFYLKDTSPSRSAVAGAIVRVFSADGALVYTQVETDEAGHGGFLLASGIQYQARFYKFGVSFKNPLFFTVFDAPIANTFDVPVDLVAAPVPSDPRLCTAYGYFRDVTGAPQPGVELIFIARFRPLLLDGSALLNERRATRTDARGYAQMNLIRFAQYDVTVAGSEDYQRLISVPDAPNTNLPDLLFPVVARVEFDPPGPITLGVGQTLQVVPTVIASDGNQIDPTGDVIWRTTDQSILGVQLGGGILTLMGTSPGVAGVSVTRADQTIIRIPDVGIQNSPLVVTVQ